MPGGKGPASSSGGESFVSGNLGLIALFAGVVLVFGGIVAANQAGLFDDSGAGSGEVLSCEETFTGRSVHEHAGLEVYLNSSEPVDFSQQKYQLADNRIHFEGGDGRTVHVHEARPTIGCLFQTFNWQVGPDRLELPNGEVYEADANHEFEVLKDGEPADRGFDTPLEGQSQYVVRYTYTGGASDGGDAASNESGNTSES